MYLDNAATTPLRTDVKEYVISLLDEYGNPSSTYTKGMSAKRVIEDARDSVAKFINANQENIIFTSSGSASNSLAILGLDYGSNYFVCSPTAHKSMRYACLNCRVSSYYNVDENGCVDMSSLRSQIFNKYIETPVVCVEAANSEIGVVQDIYKIADLVHKYNGILVLDCTGYIPHFKLDVQRLKGKVIVTFSAHKLGALKGVGVTYISPGIKLRPLVFGSQEHGLFAGTENVIGIASLGKAVEDYEYKDCSVLRDYLHNRILREIPDCYLVGQLKNRLPNNLYICFKGKSGDALVAMLDEDEIEVSTGSACNSGTKTPSSTLQAIGMDEQDIHSCIRFTLSGDETFAELDEVVEKLKKRINMLGMID